VSFRGPPAFKAMTLHQLDPQDLTLDIATDARRGAN
jgi:hypothetical protein